MRTITAAVLAGGVARSVSRATPPGPSSRWERTSHAGSSVTLWEGPAFVAGALAGSAVAGVPAVAAGALAGVVGAIDDHAGDTRRKGLSGHLRALARGEVTTGSLKIIGLVAAGVVATAGHDARRAPGDPGGAHRAWGRTLATLAGAGLVAGSANLANLLDLRPGRALKATLAVATPVAVVPGPGRVTAAAAVGAAVACLPDDLAGRSMLGDTGANAAGALVGLAVTQRAGTAGRLLALGIVTVLTLASERVSFTTVIERTPGLREIDAWGRGSPA